MLACVRAEAASALSKPDPLGAILAPVADLTVDLWLMSCHCGAVQSLPAGHCRGQEESRSKGWPPHLSLLHPEPQAKNTSVTPGTSRASVYSESLSKQTWSGRQGKRLREEKQMFGIRSGKGGRSQHCNRVWSLGPARNSDPGELMNPTEWHQGTCGVGQLTYTWVK